MRHLALFAVLLLVSSMSLQLGWAQGSPAEAEDEKAGRPETAGDDGAKGEGGDGASTQDSVDPERFGEDKDEAFGAFQRGRYLTALELARPRAEAGNAAAQTLIAEIYARGLGVPRSPERAAEWYKRAAEQGDPHAQMQYALMLIDGKLVEQDRDRAFALMRSAAEAGEALAQFNLAQMLLDSGTGEEEAVRWYERAAKAGLADAQYALAQVHLHGIGNTPPDEKEALRWLQRAAGQNFDAAQLELGTWLVEGRGGEMKPEQGFAWLKRAAQSGNVAAQNRVAKLYRSGVGVEPDPVLAAAWYMQARRAGLTDPIMEDHLNGLTEEELDEAAERTNSLR